MFFLSDLFIINLIKEKIERKMNRVFVALMFCSSLLGCRRAGVDQSDPRLMRFSRPDNNYVYIWGASISPNQGCFFELITPQELTPDNETNAFLGAAPINKKPVDIALLRNKINDEFLKRKNDYQRIQGECAGVIKEQETDLMTAENGKNAVAAQKKDPAKLSLLESLVQGFSCLRAGGAAAYKRLQRQMQGSQRINAAIAPQRRVFGLGFWPLEATGLSKGIPGQAGQEDGELLRNTITKAEGPWIINMTKKDCPGPDFFSQNSF